MIEIRASSLSYYNDCPRRASTQIFSEEIKAKGYELKRFGFRNISANIGTACHSGAEVAMNEKNVKQAVSASLDELSELNKDVKFDAVSPNQNTAEKQTERITRTYHHEVAENIIPLNVEKRLKAKINNDFILTGKPDLITFDILRDFKTGKNTNCQAQMGAYSILAKAHDIEINKLFIDSIKNTRLDKPQIYEKIQFKMDVCERLTKAVIKRIQADYKVFEFPCNNNSMLCSAKWCRAYGTDYCEVTK